MKNQAGGALKFAQYSLKTPQRTLLADRDVVLAAVEQSPVFFVCFEGAMSKV